MKTYKFRGKRLDNGEYAYGDLIQGDNGVYIRQWTDAAQIEVDNDTLAQFSGERDAEGSEMYEGDVIEFDYAGEHYKYTVHFRAFATAPNGCYMSGFQFKEYIKS